MKLNVNKKSENSVFKSVEVSKAIKKKKNKRKNKKAIVVAETVTEMPIKIDSVATAPKNKEKPTKKKASKPITKTKIENSALCSKINEKSRRHQKNSPFRRVVEEEVDPELLKKMGKNAFVHKVKNKITIKIKFFKNNFFTERS